MAINFLKLASIGFCGLSLGDCAHKSVHPEKEIIPPILALQCTPITLALGKYGSREDCAVSLRPDWAMM